MSSITSPDRTHAPAFGTIDKVEISRAKPVSLSNGLPVFEIDAGIQELVKIECIFPKAGAWDQPLPIVSVGTNDMLDEGTKNYSSSALAEAIDYFGAFIQSEATMDFASVSLFSLNKHLKDTVPLLEEIVKRAAFPEHEFKTYIQNKKQKFLVDEAKVATVARKKFTELLFGNKYPYGHYLIESEFEAVNRDILASFYASKYTSDQCHIVISGKLDKDLNTLMEKHFGGDNWKSKDGSVPRAYEISTEKQRKQFILKKDAVQSAIRIGRIMFNKTHPDYLGMQVLNTVFGGYFGSRLMANIREDKGYTYGIGSGIVSLKNCGYFFISTEVGVDVCKNAIQEIYSEMRRLREELIPDAELELVRNYMLGTFLRSADGPFALADKFKGIYDFGLDYSYYERFVHTIKTISPDALRKLANTYLQEEDMIELVVGKM